MSPSKPKALNLAKLHAALRAKHADAPSYITLRRWASDGRLVKAQIPGDGKKARAQYGLREVERIFHLRSKGRSPPPGIAQISEDATDEVNTLGAGNAMSEQLTDAVRVLTVQLADQDLKLSKLLDGIRALDFVRVAMMAKYDAVTANQAEVIDALRARLKAAETTADFHRMSLRIGAQLGTLADRVDLVQATLQTQRP